MAHDRDGNVVPMNESELPVLLPQLNDFKPTGTEAPPLSSIDWVEIERGWKISDARDQHHATVGWFLLILTPDASILIMMLRLGNRKREVLDVGELLYVGG